MSLVDDLKSGFTPGAFNDAPFVPSGVWYAKLPLNTASIVGLTLFGYVERSEFSQDRLFDLTVSNVTENNSVFAMVHAPSSETDALQGCTSAFVTFGFTEDSTQEKHVLYRGVIQVQSGIA